MECLPNTGPADGSVSMAHVVKFWNDSTSVSVFAASAWAFAALAPAKDAEVVLHGRSLACPALAALLHAALRAFIDRLGVTAFNVAALNLRADGAPADADRPVVVRHALFVWSARWPEEVLVNITDFDDENIKLGQDAVHITL